MVFLSKEHTYVKRNQAASFKSLVEGCDGKSVMLQVDFSENADEFLGHEMV